MKEHEAGHKECKEQQRETQILQIQDKYKVGRRRALQILAGEETTQTPSLITDHYPKHFLLKFRDNLKEATKINPFIIKKSINLFLNSNVSSIRGQGENYIINVSNNAQSENITKITTINKLACAIVPHETLNSTKCLIYTNDFHTKDLTKFSAKLWTDYKITAVTEATWIKPKNTKSRAFILDFTQEQTPELINIDGERAKTKIYPYYPTPMRCRRCQLYGHTEKRCDDEKRRAICGRCSEHHLTTTCRSDQIKCYHCNENHFTGDKSCRIQRYEKEIITIQTKHKTSRQGAIILLAKQNINRNTTYADS